VLTDSVPFDEGGCSRRNIETGGGVEKFKSGLGIEGHHRFILGVNDGQVWGKLLENGDRGRLIVDEDASFAGGENLAAKDDLIGVGVEAIGFEYLRKGLGVGFEDGGDNGFVTAVADDVGRSFLAEEQSKGVYEDGLASAGFAGQKVQAGAKLHYHVVDDSIVFDAQFEQQRKPFSSVGVERRIAEHLRNDEWRIDGFRRR